MQKQLEVAHSIHGLTTSSNISLVIAEQPDKKEVIKIIAHLLQRLSKLFQLPNWDEANAVYLAEWVHDNYKYDSLQDVIKCLENPPDTGEKNWRLTPDTIRQWMGIILEKTAIKREEEHKRLKETNLEPLTTVDYEAFKKRIEKDGLPNPKRVTDNNLQYKEWRAQYLTKKLNEEKKEV